MDTTIPSGWECSVFAKYMVQNTVGRIYLDNNPYETQLQKKWQYLVEPSEKPDDKALLKYNELEDLKVADLACDSGHILNECFDLLYDLYIAEGYGRGEAVENIFIHNLTGIDLDTRPEYDILSSSNGKEELNLSKSELNNLSCITR